MDPQKQKNTNAFKFFLNYMDDKFLKYDIASDLGFDDLMLHTVATTPGLHSLKLDS